MKKSFLIKVVSLMLVALMILSFAACKNDDGDAEDTTAADTTNDPYSEWLDDLIGDNEILSKLLSALMTGSIEVVVGEGEDAQSVKAFFEDNEFALLSDMLGEKAVGIDLEYAKENFAESAVAKLLADIIGDVISNVASDETFPVDVDALKTFLESNPDLDEKIAAIAEKYAGVIAVELEESGALAVEATETETKVTIKLDAETVGKFVSDFIDAVKDDKDLIALVKEIAPVFKAEATAIDDFFAEEGVAESFKEIVPLMLTGISVNVEITASETSLALDATITVPEREETTIEFEFGENKLSAKVEQGENLFTVNAEGNTLEFAINRIVEYYSSDEPSELYEKDLDAIEGEATFDAETQTLSFNVSSRTEWREFDGAEDTEGELTHHEEDGINGTAVFSQTENGYLVDINIESEYNHADYFNGEFDGKDYDKTEVDISLEISETETGYLATVTIVEVAEYKTYSDEEVISYSNNYEDNVVYSAELVASDGEYKIILSSSSDHTAERTEGETKTPRHYGSDEETVLSLKLVDDEETASVTLLYENTSEEFDDEDEIDNYSYETKSGIIFNYTKADGKFAVSLISDEETTPLIGGAVTLDEGGFTLTVDELFSIIVKADDTMPEYVDIVKMNEEELNAFLAGLMMIPDVAPVAEN